MSIEKQPYIDCHYDADGITTKSIIQTINGPIEITCTSYPVNYEQAFAVTEQSAEINYGIYLVATGGDNCENFGIK